VVSRRLIHLTCPRGRRWLHSLHIHRARASSTLNFGLDTVHDMNSIQGLVYQSWLPSNWFEFSGVMPLGLAAKQPPQWRVCLDFAGLEWVGTIQYWSVFTKVPITRYGTQRAVHSSGY
jgi:hypothetical protein